MDLSSDCFIENIMRSHTCHTLWTEICEINQTFKGDLIKFCEIFTKITLELPQNNQKASIFMLETCDKHNKV